MTSVDKLSPSRLELILRKLEFNERERTYPLEEGGNTELLEMLIEAKMHMALGEWAKTDFVDNQDNPLLQVVNKILTTSAEKEALVKGLNTLVSDV